MGRIVTKSVDATTSQIADRVSISSRGERLKPASAAASSRMRLSPWRREGMTRSTGCSEGNGTTRGSARFLPARYVTIISSSRICRAAGEVSRAGALTIAMSSGPASTQSRMVSVYPSQTRSRISGYCTAIFEIDIEFKRIQVKGVETIDLDAILQQDARAAFAEIVSTGSDLAPPDADRGAQ
jgi:hypothetical protein